MTVVISQPNFINSLLMLSLHSKQLPKTAQDALILLNLLDLSF